MPTISISKYILLLFLLLNGITIFGQIHVLSGTQLKLENNTILSLENSSGEFYIDSNVSFQNEGEIHLGANVKLNEQKGFPIFGIGFEKYDSTIIGNFSELNCGGMGFIITGYSYGNMTIIRNHTSLSDSAGGFTVNRYFTISPIDLNIDTVQLMVDTTELNGNQFGNLFVIGTKNSGYYNFGNTNNPDYTAFIGNDSISLFSLTSFQIKADSLNQNAYCENDTLIMHYSKIGFDNNGPYILQRSDENGNFSFSVNLDTALLINEELIFKIPASIIESTNYSFRIHQSELTIFSDEISNISLSPNPPIPIISINFDTLECNQIGFTYKWYLDGNEIIGANNSTHHVNQNGSYTVEITNNSGCSSISNSIIFNALELKEINSETIQIFPNPSNGIFNIKSNENVEIFVYDYQARLIFNSTLSSKDHEINIENESSGIYFIRSINSSFESNEKIVVIEK